MTAVSTAQAAAYAVERGLVRREARMLAMRAAACTVEEFLTGRAEVRAEGMQWLANAVDQRNQGRPLQYILGEWEFYGLLFFVDERVLIPREETELLVELALRAAKERGYETALDLCTGSGCIAVCLAQSGLRVAAADISSDALLVAKKNALRHGADIQWLEGDLFAPVAERYDLIACNPPYVSEGEMASLQREVRFEPALALEAGDGCAYYRRIAPAARDFLTRGGALFVEVGKAQAQGVVSLFESAGFINVETCTDMAGIARVVRGYLPE